MEKLQNTKDISNEERDYIKNEATVIKAMDELEKAQIASMNTEEHLLKVRDLVKIVIDETKKHLSLIYQYGFEDNIDETSIAIAKSRIRGFCSSVFNILLKFRDYEINNEISVAINELIQLRRSSEEQIENLWKEEMRKRTERNMQSMKQKKYQKEIKDNVYQIMHSINTLPIAELEKMVDLAEFPFQLNFFNAMIDYRKERDKLYYRSQTQSKEGKSKKCLTELFIEATEIYYNDIYYQVKTNNEITSKDLLSEIDKIIVYEKSILTVLRQLLLEAHFDEFIQSIHTLSKLRSDIQTKIINFGAELDENKKKSDLERSCFT